MFIQYKFSSLAYVQKQQMDQIAKQLIHLLKLYYQLSS